MIPRMNSCSISKMNFWRNSKHRSGRNSAEALGEILEVIELGVSKFQVSEFQKKLRFF